MEFRGKETEMLDFYTLRVNVIKGGEPLKAARISMSSASMPSGAPQDTDAAGMANLLFLDNEDTYTMKVEYDGHVEEVEVSAEELRYGNITIDLSG